MKLLVLLLVVGTTTLSLTAAMPQELPPLAQMPIKKQITTKLCSGNPSSQSQCMTEVEECLEFLQIDPTAEDMPKPELEKVCNGTSNAECHAKVAECGKLFDKKPADEPQSLTSLDTLPTKENLELMCTFMKIDNCTQTFEKCFELIGPTANITGFPTREMFECSKVFDDYIEVTKNISATAEGTGPSSANGTSETSVSTTEESSIPSRQTMEIMCLGSDAPNCVERVEECFQLVGPGAAAITTPTKEMIECSQFLAQFADPAEASSIPSRETMEIMCQGSDIPNCVERVEECFQLVGPGASAAGTPTPEMIECSQFLAQFADPTEASSIPSRQTMEIMCQASNTPDCVERVGECFQLVGPGASATGTPTPEMIECSQFLAQFADPTEGAVNPADVPEIVEGSVDATDAEEAAVSMEMIEVVCRSFSEPNCAQRFEECSSLLSSGADVPTTLNREMTECSKFLQNFTDVMTNFTGTTDATTTSTAVPGRDVTGTTQSSNITTTTSRTTSEATSSTGDDRGQTPTERTRRPFRTTTTTTTTTTERPGHNATDSKEKNIEDACEILEIPNCVNRVKECFMVQENNTANRTEAEKCAMVISSYEDIKKNLTQRVASERQPCITENCKKCETLIRPTRSFTSSEDECRTNTELSLKECMKPILERHLRLVARPDIRRQIVTFLDSCYPENSYEGITPCIIGKCSDIIARSN